jgi:hypothetical protein
MRRVLVMIVVLLALLGSGCFGGSSANTAARRSPQPKDTALVVHLSMTFLGQPPISQAYRISCGQLSTGDAAVTVVCSRLTGSFKDRYFATPPVSVVSAGPMDATVTIRGRVNGRPVARSYYLGGEQFRNWMQILGRDPSGFAPRHGDAVVGWRVLRP